MGFIRLTGIIGFRAYRVQGLGFIGLMGINAFTGFIQLLGLLGFRAYGLASSKTLKAYGLGLGLPGFMVKGFRGSNNLDPRVT